MKVTLNEEKLQIIGNTRWRKGNCSYEKHFCFNGPSSVWHTTLEHTGDLRIRCGASQWEPIYVHIGHGWLPGTPGIMLPTRPTVNHALGSSDISVLKHHGSVHLSARLGNHSLIQMCNMPCHLAVNPKGACPAEYHKLTCQTKVLAMVILWQFDASLGSEDEGAYWNMKTRHVFSHDGPIVSKQWVVHDASVMNCTYSFMKQQCYGIFRSCLGSYWLFP